MKIKIDITGSADHEVTIKTLEAIITAIKGSQTAYNNLGSIGKYHVYLEANNITAKISEK